METDNQCPNYGEDRTCKWHPKFHLIPQIMDNCCFGDYGNCPENILALKGIDAAAMMPAGELEAMSASSEHEKMLQALPGKMTQPWPTPEEYMAGC